MFARGYDRTCQSCGYSWQISRAQAKLRVHKPGMRSRAGRRSANRSAQLGFAQSMSQQTDLVVTLTHCARCGGKEYTQVQATDYQPPKF
jgi:cytochrome c553